MKRILTVLVLVTAFSLSFAYTVMAAPLVQTTSPFDLTALIEQLASLAGIGAFFSMLVNAIKTFNLVPPDQAGNLQTGVTILALVILWVLNIFRPEWITKVDSIAGVLAQFGVYVIALIISVGGGKLSHAVLRGFPLIGHSTTLSEQKALSSPNR